MALRPIRGSGALTYRSDSASGRDGANGAGRLSEGVAEHIKREHGRFGDEREAIATRCNWREGRLGRGAAFAKRANGDFLREGQVMERQSLSEGGKWGLSWSDRPISAHCAVLPGNPEAALTIQVFGSATASHRGPQGTTRATDSALLGLRFLGLFISSVADIRNCEFQFRMSEL